jgi:hypothetical protein
MSNNINVRLNKAKQNVKQEINSPGGTITNKLSGLTNTFKNFFSDNSANTKPATKNNTQASSKQENKTVNNNGHDPLANPFNNPLMLWSLIIITVGFIGYGIYYYYKTTGTIESSKSYYGTDLLSYTPVFKMNSEQIDPCIKRCEADPLCDGITFNKDELNCVGTTNGLLRDDNANLSAWLKPPAGKNNNKKSIVMVGLATEATSISADKISYPSNPMEFNWSFNFYLNDHMGNHGTWRHIMHKGTDNVDQIDTPNWEDILAMYPDQSVGVWMAPYNNNLRIALTTITAKPIPIPYPHALKEEADTQTGDIYLTDKPNPPYWDTSKYRTTNKPTNYEKNIEFFDVYQVPVKKLRHLSINVVTNVVELYVDGKLYKSFTLTGRPEFNKGNLYIMKAKTIDGYLQKIAYSPSALKKNAISALV